MYTSPKKKEDILAIVVKHFEEARDNYFNADMQGVTAQQFTELRTAYDTMWDLITDIKIF